MSGNYCQKDIRGTLDGLLLWALWIMYAQLNKKWSSNCSQSLSIVYISEVLPDLTNWVEGGCISFHLSCWYKTPAVAETLKHFSKRFMSGPNIWLANEWISIKFCEDIKAALRINRNNFFESFWTPTLPVTLPSSYSVSFLYSNVDSYWLNFHGICCRDLWSPEGGDFIWNHLQVKIAQNFDFCRGVSFFCCCCFVYDLEFLS